VLDKLPADLYLSFNSGPALVFGHSLQQLLSTCDLSRVVIELTEHVAVEDYQRLCATLAPMRAAGARLSIDDTGAGFASLSHILKLAPDLIKIDRSLVESVDTDASRRILASALAKLGTEIGATVIAEGVQTEAEALTWHNARPGLPVRPPGSGLRCSPYRFARRRHCLNPSSKETLPVSVG
jgi:EAL domain-containing protein (putative c-di-GMP-specific phosphodiesterase class I)